MTRALRATIVSVSASAPNAGRHLKASIYTGNQCRYEPAAGGPSAGASDLSHDMSRQAMTG